MGRELDLPEDASDAASIDSPPVRTEVTAEPLEAVDADLHVTGLAQGEELDDAYRELPGAGDARGGFRSTRCCAPTPAVASWWSGSASAMSSTPSA